MPNPIADPFVESVDSDASNPSVRIEATRAGAATVWIDRPQAGNALDPLTMAALHEAFETLKGAQGVRIVFVRGAGGVFCGGVDRAALELSTDLSEADHRQNALNQGLMLKALSDCPAFTVALVEGEAQGSGIGLIAACDFAVATSAARFAFSQVRLGLPPAIEAPYVVEAVGVREARTLFALGRPFDAAYAVKIGLVDCVAADAADLDAVAAALAEEMMSCAPGAVATAKALVREVAERPIDHALMDDLAHRAARARMDDEGQEGVAAFLENRRPDWTEI